MSLTIRLSKPSRTVVCPMSECASCGSEENLQEHHLSYGPEVTVRICKDCHNKVHGHGTGVGQDLDKERLIDLLSYDELDTGEMSSVLECSKATVRKYRRRLDHDRWNCEREPPKNFKKALEVIEYERQRWGRVVDVKNLDEIREAIGE